MSFELTPDERNRLYSSFGTNIVASVRDIIEIDPLDNTKLKVKAPYTLRTVDASDPTNIAVTDLEVSITSGISHTIPAGFTFWIGVQDVAGVVTYSFNADISDFDLETTAIIGRAFTDETVPGQLNGVVGTFWWEGWNYAKTLYDSLSVRDLSYLITNGGITLDAALTYTRESGTWWRFMAYNSLKDPSKGIDVQTAVTAYFTYPAVGAFEQTSTFEVGFFEDGGVKTAVPVNKWSVYKVYHFASSNFESAQRGKQTYDSLHEALSRKGEEDLPVHDDLKNAVLTHLAYVQAGATDLTDTERVKFEAINPDGLSSGGDPLTSSLQFSGLVDWVGTDILTINADTTKFDVGQFRVGRVDRSADGEVKFVRTVATQAVVTVTNLTTAPFSFVGYDITAAAIVQQVTPFSRVNLDNVIPLGRLWHRNKTNLDIAQTMPLVFETSHDYAGQILAFGALKQTGFGLSANGANKKTDLASGVLEVIGGTSTDREAINIAQPIAAVPLSHTPVHKAISTGKAVLETVTDIIDFTKFEDGSGTPATLLPNKFGNHYFCIFPFRTVIDAFLIRGSVEYATLTAAQDGLIRDAIPVPTDLVGGICIGVILAKENTTDLAAAITAGNAEFAAADRFGSFGGGGGAGAAAPITLAQFSVTKSTSQSIVTANVSQVTWDGEDYDIGDNFASNQFTAPVAARYHFDSSCRFQTSTLVGESLIRLHVNGTENKRAGFAMSGVDNLGNNDFAYGLISADIQLAQGDTVDVRVSHQESTNKDILGGFSAITWFTGHQLPS